MERAVWKEVPGASHIQFTPLSAEHQGRRLEADSSLVGNLAIRFLMQLLLCLRSALAPGRSPSLSRVVVRPRVPLPCLSWWQRVGAIMGRIVK